jgi:2'-5' RNA ligase
MSHLVLAYPIFKDRDLVWIQAIRNDNDRNFRMVKPHFTLVFEEKDIPEEEFIGHVKMVAEETEPIKISIRGATMVYGPMEPTWFAFLIPDEGNYRINRLHDSLYSGILAEKRLWKIPYKPHITVGHFDKAENCRKLVNEINRKEVKIEGMIDSIDVVEYDNNAIRTIEKFNLR